METKYLSAEISNDPHAVSFGEEMFIIPYEIKEVKRDTEPVYSGQSVKGDNKVLNHGDC